MLRKRFLIGLILLLVGLPGIWPASAEEKAVKDDKGFVAVLDMEMMILPGTQSYLENSLKRARQEGAKVVVIEINTPGGMLNTSQKMIQMLFAAPLPVVVYVTPSGASATSAGVFITMAAHIAAMAPGTSIGSAAPVSGDGKDIEGDMRAKAQNMTIAMVKAIAEQRGRNVEWAEQAVKESSSITESEALKKKVVDIVAKDLDDLLRQLKGRRVKIDGVEVVLGDFSSLPRSRYQISFADKVLNILANPTIAAILWLLATTGISIELYSPGAILPGVVGVICLVLALLVSQVVPISYGGVMLLVLGVALMSLEFVIPSGIFAVGGLIAMVLGALYLVDVSQAPGMNVSLEFLLPIAALLGTFMLVVVHGLLRSSQKQVTTGFEGMVGVRGKALESFSGQGRVFVNGEIWSARLKSGVVATNDQIEVIGGEKGLVLDIVRVVEQEKQ